ncbi:unnamed protein product [Paramecium octaurelia]|uniref:Uncharacterized protein n=1 Tax=Paramecium octaurelia TaxID=43137 RepID=A0A8S1VF30_PAROT|nr:unnamed protein product [Paramecium octaurelia]
MSETSLIAYSDREIESSLKDLLERILMQLEKYIENKNDLNEVEQELKDYEDQSQLVNIIKIIFTNLMLKIERKIRKLENSIDPITSSQSIRAEDEYEKLEQSIIKQESEIRNHIRLEQQLKLHAESIQQKLEDSEATRNELLETTKNMMNILKRENQKYYEENQFLQAELVSYKEKIQLLELEQQKRTIELDHFDYKVQQQPKNTQQIKGMIQRKSNDKETNRVISHSQHKLSSQFQESTDYPTQSQGSLNQNYFNILQFEQNHPNNSLNQSINHQQEQIKGYQMKHKSICSINDLQYQNVIKNIKTHIGNYTVSKNNSQNSSILQKNIHQNIQTQPRSRSGSLRRNIYQKQKTSIHQC